MTVHIRQLLKLVTFDCMATELQNKESLIHPRNVTIHYFEEKKQIPVFPPKFAEELHLIMMLFLQTLDLSEYRLSRNSMSFYEECLHIVK